MTTDGAWLVPRYDDTVLGALLPGVAASLGHDLGRPAVALPAADRVCVVIIDGLGHRLLLERRPGAPFLSSLMVSGRALIAGCPSTTATSMASFGTGLPPGRHGLVGYEVMDPDRGELLNELRWHPDTDPLAWQPHPTVFEELARRGVAVTQIGNPEFLGSGLTIAALRGAAFAGLPRLRDRVDAAVDRLREPGLVYLYWADVDSVGHVHGWRSAQWRRTVRAVDRELARLSRTLPAGTAAGGHRRPRHGRRAARRSAGPGHPARPVVAVPGARVVRAGSRRSTASRDTPVERVEDLARQLADWVGERAWVGTRIRGDRRGLVRSGRGSGPAAPGRRHRGRPGAVHPGRLAHRPARMCLSLIGQHGSLTADEQLVPLLVHRS